MPNNFLTRSYENDFSVEESKRFLSKIPREIGHLNFALVGGWAVYYAVSDWYEKLNHGRRYIYSRDLDFLVEKNDIEKFAQYLEKNNFVSEGKYGYRKYYKQDRLKGMVNVDKYEYEETLATSRAEFIIDLFTNDKTTNTKLLKQDRYAVFLPHIKHIFENETNFEKKTIFGHEYKIPKPSILLELKKIGLEAEKRDIDKRIKDIIDSVALIMCYNLTEEAKKYDIILFLRKYIGDVVKSLNFSQEEILSYFE